MTLQENFLNSSELEKATISDEFPSSPSVTVSVDLLTVAMLVLSILYTFCLILARRKLRALSHMSTRKLLVLSVGVVCLVRTMTLLGVMGMNIANVRAHYALQPPKHDSNFYDKSMTVLLDLPNCIVVSTYVLLTLVWAECFLESRFHTEDVRQWKRAGLVGYTLFNAVLYATQLVLYACIFLVTSGMRTILYAAITGMNFTSVVMVMLVYYLYLNMRFSGFPFRSDHSRRSLGRVSSVMTLWSTTRILWGAATLVVFCYKIELLQDSNTPLSSFAVLLLLFFVCEIVPILAMLDYSYMNMIGLELLRGGGGGGATSHDSSVVLWPDDLLVMRQPLLSADRDQREESRLHEDEGRAEEVS